MPETKIFLKNRIYSPIVLLKWWNFSTSFGIGAELHSVFGAKIRFFVERWTHFEIPLDGKEGGRRLMMMIPLHAVSGREQMEF